MAIQVSLGYYYGDRRDMNKQIWVHSVGYSGTLRNDSNVVNPSILLNAAADDIADCSYMEIPAFNRKYYITDITSVSNSQSIVSGHVDVLETYKGDIKSSTGIVSRSSSAGDPFINDGSIRTKTTKSYKVVRGFAKFNDYSIILVTV